MRILTKLPGNSPRQPPIELRSHVDARAHPGGNALRALNISAWLMH